MVSLMLLGLDIEVPAWVILLPACAILLYIYSGRNHGYYKKQGIHGPKPLPFFGNMLDFANLDKIGELDVELRKKYGDFVASYMGSRPNLTVYDQELLSDIMVKQFHKLPNRQTLAGDKMVELMLTNLKDEHWKHVQTIMSPTFTTGKLRQMATEINRCAKQLTEKLTGCEGPFDTKELAGLYTMDVIASTTFGLRVDSQSGNGHNEFVRHAKNLLDIDFRKPVLLLGFLFPPLGKLFYKLGFQIVDKKATDYFCAIIKQTMESRKEGDTSRADFVQLMCNAKRGESNYNKEDEHEVEKLDMTGNKKGLTDEEILSNALIFFLAGSETTSLGLTMLLYCLALNQDCQNKLHEEIDQTLGDKEFVTYDDVMKMHYLDQCMHESLRLYPGTPRVDRVAGEDIDLNGITVPKDSAIIIPIYAMQRDPRIWPDPEKFDPERFSPEGRAQRNPITWLAFGYGPRHCIGQRLAMYELKVAVVHVLRNHMIVRCSKTEDPDKIQWKKGIWMKAENGVWLSAERRK